MNSVGGLNKGSIIRRLAILLSVILSILSLSACGTTLAPDAVQGAADVVKENDTLDDETSLGTNEGTAEEAMSFQDQGMVIGKGCGTPEVTRHSEYMKKAYQLGKSIN